MPDVKITVLKTSTADDIFGSYAHENCERTRDKYEEGDEFVVKHDDFRVPEGLCPSAWDSISGLVLTLMHGEVLRKGFGWKMKTLPFLVLMMILDLCFSG